MITNQNDWTPIWRQSEDTPKRSAEDLVAVYTYEHNDGDQIWEDDVRYYALGDGKYERQFTDGYYNKTSVSIVSAEEIATKFNEIKSSPYQLSNPAYRGGFSIQKDFTEVPIKSGIDMDM